jgi:hypothetical protein
MKEAASTVQQRIVRGQIYKTHLSNFLSEVSNLPADIAPHIEFPWRNWHSAVQNHFQLYSLLAQGTEEGAQAMGEQDRLDAQGFDALAE